MAISNKGVGLEALLAGVGTAEKVGAAGWIEAAEALADSCKVDGDPDDLQLYADVARLLADAGHGEQAAVMGLLATTQAVALSRRDALSPSQSDVAATAMHRAVTTSNAADVVRSPSRVIVRAFYVRPMASRTPRGRRTRRSSSGSSSSGDPSRSDGEPEPPPGPSAAKADKKPGRGESR